jgi:two-component SAPR family response regulator
VTHSRFLFLWWLSGGVILIAVVVFFFIRASNRPGRAAESAAVAKAGVIPDKVAYSTAYVQEVAEKNHRSAIYLFGPFQVFDKEGNDISQLFSPLLKELFLVLVTYTISNGRGISSNELNEILWRDKSEKDAMNNRSVNLTKLKILLEKIGNCIIVKESGFWQIQVPDDEIYIDYKKYVALLQSAGDPAKGYMRQLMGIIKGPFLAQTDYNWLDDIKSGISNSGIHICLDYLDSPDMPKDPEFVVEIANCIFYFDQVNEDALIHKCKSLVLLKRHALASKTYDKFLKDYKDIYGADFQKTFQEVIS